MDTAAEGKPPLVGAHLSWLRMPSTPPRGFAKAMVGVS
jgi:hypothetical protein